MSMTTNSDIEKSCHRVMITKTYWKGVVTGAIKPSIRGRINRHEGEEIDKLQKAENTAIKEF